MNYSFSCFPHKHITAKHHKSLEFTKDEEVALEGDCIVGVKADFDAEKLREFASANRDRKIRMVIRTKTASDELVFDLNPEFSDANSIVIRKSNFLSNRTLGVDASKAASDLKRELAQSLKEDKIEVELSPLVLNTLF
ncbi:MAG TPA: DUF371 domain-containing protein [Candidatus Nanoarchaeia archaeon]|nr:DUF371 domain-containing protein [Candidatus Nanoarchaeia archaeon]